jgi:uncharacterized protein with PIN domain
MCVEEHARRVFLSHVSEDKEIVERIAKMQVKFGVPVWYDAWEIGWGDRIVAKISEGLESCGDIIVFLSSAAVESEWVKREINSKLLDQIADKNVRILPIKLEDACAIPQLLKEYRWVSLSKPKGYYSGFEEIIRTLLPKSEAEAALVDLNAIVAEFGTESLSSQREPPSSMEPTCVYCGGPLNTWTRKRNVEDGYEYESGIQCLQCGMMYNPRERSPKCPKCNVPMIWSSMGSSEGAYGLYEDDFVYVCPKCGGNDT